MLISRGYILDSQFIIDFPFDNDKIIPGGIFMKKIFYCLLVITLVVSFSACQSASKPEDTIKGYFEAAKISDTEKANTFINPKNVSLEDSSSTSSSGGQEEIDLVNNLLDYLKDNNKKVTYNITNTEIKDNSATVSVNCKFVDASAILKDAIADYIPKAFAKAFTESQSPDDSAKEITELMKNKIQTAKETFAEKAIKINCVKTDNKWYINKVDDDLQNVFTSNLLSAGNEIFKSFGGTDSSDNSSSSNTSQAKSAKDKLSEINDYIISDIWGKGFCDISWYLTTGKSSTGETLDIDFTLQQLEDAMEKKLDYDSYISELDDSKYSKIKDIWTKLSAETDSLYQTVKAKKPIANSNTAFDTGKFEQYQEAFSDAIDNVKK